MFPLVVENVFTAGNIWETEKNCFPPWRYVFTSQKKFLLGIIKFFFKLWTPNSLNNATLFYLDRKIILQLLFLLVETNTEIRKDSIFKK